LKVSSSGTLRSRRGIPKQKIVHTVPLAAMYSTPASEKSDNHKLGRQAVIFAMLGWPAADLAVVVGLLISGTAHASIADWLRMLCQVGLIGVLAGLTVWAVYRLVRSAAKNDPPQY
jgi:hypothetical protein